MKKGRVSKPQVVYSCIPFKVLKRRAVFPNGNHFDYYSVFKGATNQYVVIIGIQGGDTLILVNQWRPTTGEWNLSLPMGAVEKDETPLNAAKREFIEETGYIASKYEELGMYYESPGHSAQKGFVFLATGLKLKSKIKTDDKNVQEVVKLKLLKIRDLFKMISEGGFRDGSSLNALALFMARTFSRPDSGGNKDSSVRPLKL